MDDLQPSENEDKSPHSNPDTAGTFVPLTLRKAVVQTQLWGSGTGDGGSRSSTRPCTTVHLTSGFQSHLQPSQGNVPPGFLTIILGETIPYLKKGF